MFHWMFPESLSFMSFQALPLDPSNCKSNKDTAEQVTQKSENIHGWACDLPFH
jgi:hypothetical protein